MDIFASQFLLRAVIGTMLLSLLTSLWGVFVVLRKQAFLSDAVAHTSIMGIAIGLLLGIYPILIAIIIAIIFAITLTYFKDKLKAGSDTMIGIIYSLFFAIGLIIISKSTGIRVDLNSYLFGSILTISYEEIFLILFLLLISTLFLFKNYKDIVYSTLDEENAFLRGINVKRNEYIINIFLSITVIVAIKAVGLIMLSALLLAPAAYAKNTAKNFKQVIPIASTISILGSIAGLIISITINTPPGATIVIVLSLLYLTSNIPIKKK